MIALPVQVNEEHNQVKHHEYQTVSHVDFHHSSIVNFRRIVQSNVTPGHSVDFSNLPDNRWKITQKQPPMASYQLQQRDKRMHRYFRNNPKVQGVTALVCI